MSASTEPSPSYLGIPVAPLALGLAGLIPFWGLALATLMHSPLGLDAPGVSLALAAYAAIISFLGGIRWGLAVARNDWSSTPYVLSVVPSLVAWAALALSEPSRLIDVSDTAADAGFDLPRDKAMGHFHVRLSSGELRSGGAAFVEIWKVLPRWRPAAMIASLPGATPALDLGYRLFSPVRPILARVIRRMR